MIPRALTKKQRSEIEQWLSPDGFSARVSTVARYVRELLADSDYWQTCNSGRQKLLVAAVDEIKTYKDEQERLLKEVDYWRAAVRDAPHRSGNAFRGVQARLPMDTGSGGSMAELTGLALRKAACEALGWTFSENLQDGWGFTPAGHLSELTDLSENDFLEWCKLNGWEWSLWGDSSTEFVMCLRRKARIDESGAWEHCIDGSTPSEARARAVVDASHV